MNVVKEILVKLGIIREEAVETITRAQTAIATVTARSKAEIEAAIDDELDVISFTIGDGFRRIANLIHTGALPTSAEDDLKKARDEMAAILDRLDAAL